MKIILNNIDLPLLIQVLFTHSEPIGFGVAEAIVLTLKGRNIETISYKQAKKLCKTQVDTNTGLVDLEYLGGKPIKFSPFYDSKKNICVYTEDYDYRTSKYKFLKILLNTFSLEDVVLKTTSYGQDPPTDFPIKDNEKFLKDMKYLLKTATKEKNSKYGVHYKITEEALNNTTEVMDKEMSNLLRLLK